MKNKQSVRVTHEEKMGRVQDYFANMVALGELTATFAEICDGCNIPNNGHSGNAIMAVCELFREATVIHKIEIHVGGRVRYVIELLK